MPVSFGQTAFREQATDDEKDEAKTAEDANGSSDGNFSSDKFCYINRYSIAVSIEVAIGTSMILF